jgi:hypothetical protein
VRQHDTPVIPRRENSKQRGRFFPKRLYKLRARVEQAIGKLKRFKRVAMRCEKTDISYSAIISFACGLMLIKSVHTVSHSASSVCLWGNDVMAKPACVMPSPLRSSAITAAAAWTACRSAFVSAIERTRSSP